MNSNYTSTLGQLLARARPNIQKLKPYSSARLNSSAAELQNNILLNANENPYNPPGQLKSCPEKSWNTLGYNYYPEPQPKALRTALAQLYNVELEQVLVGRGSDEGIDLLIRAFCCEQDAITICSPTFGMYRSYAEIQGCRVVDLPLEIEELPSPQTAFDIGATNHLKDFSNSISLNQKKLLPKLQKARLPLAAIHQNIKNEIPKLLFLPSPLAPFGTAIPYPEIYEILKLCAQYNVLLVIDEAYAEFAQILEPSYQSVIPLLKQYPNLVVLRTLSKAYGFAGERIGSLLAAPEIVQLLRAVQAPYPIPGSISNYISHLLQDAEALQTINIGLKEICQQHSRLLTVLKTLPYLNRIFVSAANFIMVQMAQSDCDPFLDYCRTHHGIILRNFSRDIPGALRISIGSSAQIDRLCLALQNFH